MFKKIIATVIVAVTLLLVWKANYLINLPALLTGFSAKIGCSLTFVTSYSEEQVKKDIELYSPLFSYVDMAFNHTDASVTSRFLWQTHSATYRESVGCTLGNNTVTATPFIPSNNGLAVNISPALSTVVSEVATADNAAGYDTRALLVLKNNQIVAEYYGEGVDQNTRFMGWSMAKTLLTVIVGTLVKDGKLDVHQAQLFDHWQDDRQSITIENLLTMTSGLAFDERYDSGTDATRMLFDDAAVWRRASNQALLAEVGQQWSYSSGSSNLLSYLVASVFDHDTEQFLRYLRRSVLTPMGMDSTIVEFDPSGVFVASSFMHASARDWAKLGQLFINGGRMNDQSIVTEQWVKIATSANASSNDSRYGYHIWLNGSDPKRWPDLPANTYAAKGNKGQAVVILPDHNMVIVRLGWSKESYPLNDMAKKIIAAKPLR